MISKNYTYKLLFAITIFILSGTKIAHAQYSEYEIKAAYIFNFAKFIEWPNDANPSNDTIVLGIYKYDPFGIILEKTMIGRKANGKSWKILRVNTISEIKKCNIVLFSDVSPYELGIVLKSIKNKPILSIGDEVDEFCEIGGILNFTPQYSQNQFEINNKVALKSSITINPKLLKLAKIVSYNEDEF